MRPTPRGSRAALSVAALSLAIAAAACGGSTPSAGDPSPAGPSLPGQPAGFRPIFENVTVAPDATVIDAATAAGELRAADADGTLHFGPGAGAVRSAKPGSVLVVEGAALRKVLAVEASGDEILVRTEDATLADYVRDGHLGWDYQVDWDDLPAATYETAALGVGLDRPHLASAGGGLPRPAPIVAIAGKELKFAGAVKGFDIELKFVPGADQLGYEMSATRNNVKATVKGFVTTFRHQADFDVEDSIPSSFSAEVTGLKGEAEVSWAAFQVSDPTFDEDITAFELPLGIPIPFSVGPVPMTLNVKMNLRFVPSLSAGQASSGGSWKVTYDSEQGFQTNGSAVVPFGKSINFQADLGSKETVTAGLGPVGFGLGVEFPRLELAIGTPEFAEVMKTYAFVTTNTYVNGMYTPGTTLTSDIPPCQRSSIRFSAIAGYKLSVLGFAELSDNKLLWEKTKDRFLDDRPCTLTGEAP